MKRIRGKTLAVVLAVLFILTAVAPCAVLAAESGAADTSAAAVEFSAQNESEEISKEESDESMLTSGRETDTSEPAVEEMAGSTAARAASETEPDDSEQVTTEEEAAASTQAAPELEPTEPDPETLEKAASESTETASETADSEPEKPEEEASKTELSDSKRDKKYAKDLISPSALLAAATEPDWTKGGKGTKTDVTSKISITSRNGHFYTYSSRDLGTWNTNSFTALLNDKTEVGFTACIDPRLEGDVAGLAANKVYEMTAPMLLKAFYYGFDGPGKATIQSVTGTDDVGTNNIITHVAASEIYARLGYAYKSSVGDGFIGNSARLEELVKTYVKAIESKSVPSGYYVYLLQYASDRQDFAFGSTELVPHDGTLTIHKSISDADNAEIEARIKASSRYSLEGAVFYVFKGTKPDGVTAAQLRKRTPAFELTTGEDGKTPKKTVPAGSYYAVEKTPPPGFLLNEDQIYSMTVNSGADKIAQVSDKPIFIYLRIIKEATGVPAGTQAPSLAGAEFDVYRDSALTKKVGTLTTNANGQTNRLTTDLEGNHLLIGTYYAVETKAPAGYAKIAGKIPIDTSAAQTSETRIMLIEKKVSEPLDRVVIKIHKRSENPEITDNNPCYTLKGAEFGIYNNADCAAAHLVDKVVTDEKGEAKTSKDLVKADYWVKEIKAPGGFMANPNAIKVTKESLAQNPTQEVTVKERPVTDPAQITIIKRAAGDKKARSLAGTEFTFSYYKDYYKTEAELPEKPDRSWTIKTFESDGQYIARIKDCRKNGTFVSGDEFYLDPAGNPVFPLGTVTIRETKAAPGYVNDPDFGGGAKLLIGNIVLNNSGDAKFTVVHGMEPVQNTLSVPDTPIPPEIGTTAVDTKSRSHIVYAGIESFKLTDTVSYKNLIENTTYVLKGTLMDKATGEPFKDGEGKEVTAAKTFRTGIEISGTTEVEFEFTCDEASLKGHTLVVKEVITADESNPDYKDIPGAEHWNPDDAGQTVYFPEIGTTLVNKGTGEKFVPADTDVELTDTISYKDLLPGETYEVTGKLMDKESGKPLQRDGKDVTASGSFTAKEANGTVDVTFTFNTKGLAGKGLVAFEQLSLNGRVVAKHENLKDIGQTVTIPGVETNVSDSETGKKNSLAAEDRILVDEVTYSGLIPGKTYEITGEVKMKPEDSSLNFDEAQTIPSEIVAASGEGEVSFDAEKVTFIPAGNEGEFVSGILYVSFKVDGSSLAGEEAVVGETVRHSGNVIAVHRDIHDDKQTDFFPKGQTVAIDAESEIKNTLADKERILKDTFSYENLLPGATYRFTGKVMADTGEDEEGNKKVEEIPSVMTDSEGNPVEKGYVEFVPEEKDGTLDLYFMIDATELENRDVTVFERVTLGGEPVIIHEVLDGTQTVYVPEGRTTAIDSETKEQISMPDEEATIIDTLIYRNLIPGTEYTVKGRVMRKSTGEEVSSSLTEAAFKEGSTGTVSVAENTVTFTPEEEDGALELTFVFNASELKGEDTVLYERVYHNGREVIVHENIDDEPQTIHFPDGGTKASDPDTDDRTMKAGGPVIVRDEFFYENLLPGKQYAVTGKVMLKPAGEEEDRELEAKMVDADGNEISEHVFTPAEKNGSEYIYFEVDSTGLEGRSIVMFEKMEYIDSALEIRALIVSHEDIDDEEQTIHFPDGGTKATDSETGDHISQADESVTITDEVSFINLIPGKMYTVTGTIMDKETGKPVLSDGKEVTAQKQFVPETADGIVTMEFTFNGADLAGKSVVAFETVSSGGKEVFVHASLEDEDQTVYFPDVHTTATDKKDGDHEISYSGSVTIVDNVEYTNLLPGLKYYVSGLLMNKSTGEIARAGDSEIIGEAEFTAKEKNGTAKVSFSFDSSKLKDGEYVVFETLYEISAQTGDLHIVGVHHDLHDEAQTVKRPAPPIPPNGPRTGDMNNAAVWVFALTASAAGIAGMMLYKKRHPGK